jgi:hypothetical protein
MHHVIKDHEQLSWIVTGYFDESATDGSTPTAVVGGMLINYENWGDLSDQWETLMGHFPELRPALHMKDFGQHGRFADMSASRRDSIFSEVAKIIDERRSYTLSASLDHADYNQRFSAATKANHSTYELCFIIAALEVGKLSEVNKYRYPVPLVIDEGNAYAEQVFRAHREMFRLSRQTGFPRNIGILSFGDDLKTPALQVADVICWGARRKATNTKFLEGTEPILSLLDPETAYLEAKLDSATMEELEMHFKAITG